jgi:hypothetical protein
MGGNPARKRLTGNRESEDRIPTCAIQRIARIGQTAWSGYDTKRTAWYCPTCREATNAIHRCEREACDVLRGNVDQDHLAVESILSLAQPHLLAALMPPALDPATDAAIRPGSGTPRRDALKLLCKLLSAVERLRYSLEDVARSLPVETSTGAHEAAENHRWLARELDRMLAECTGRHISRGKKMLRFVELCFAAADPDVGTGSIKNAIEACTRLNPRR